MAQAVGAAIDELRRLKVSALRERYQEIFNEESRSSNKQFLFRRIAWRLQANAEGGLSERARHRAAHIVQDADLRTRAPKEFLPAQVPVDAAATVDRTHAQRDQRLPPPGTLLTRRIDDRQVVVKVLAEGFEFETRQYGSLSAIARRRGGTSDCRRRAHCLRGGSTIAKSW